MISISAFLHTIFHRMTYSTAYLVLNLIYLYRLTIVYVSSESNLHMTFCKVIVLPNQLLSYLVQCFTIFQLIPFHVTFQIQRWCSFAYFNGSFCRLLSTIIEIDVENTFVYRVKHTRIKSTLNVSNFTHRTSRIVHCKIYRFIHVVEFLMHE